MRNRSVWIGALVVLALGLVAWLFLGPDARSQAGDAAPQAPVAAAKPQLSSPAPDARRADPERRTPTSVVGRVTAAADRAPVAGALVLLTPKSFEGGVGRPGERAEPLYATTDAGGGFKLNAVPPGRYTVSAGAEGFLSAAFRGLTVRGGTQPPPISLQLHEGGIRLDGVVEDISGGPVEAALVSITRMDDQNILSFDRAPAGVLSDDEGGFRTTLAAGVYVATVVHPDYVGATETFELRDTAKHLTIEMTPGGVVEGVVRVRGSDTVVPHAIVIASPPSPSTGAGSFAVRGFGEHRVVTDPNGHFRLSGLPSGVLQFSAVASEYATAEVVDVPMGIAQTRSDVTIWVEPAFSISGFVVPQGAEGTETGIEGVWVGAISFRPPGLYAARRPSESDGFFEIPGVPAGGYMVAALGENELPNLTGTSATVTDASVDDVVVELAAGVTIRGRVEPPGPATVALSVDMEGMSGLGALTGIANAFVRTQTQEDGTFELHPVSPGRIKVVADADDGSHAEVSIEVGEDGTDEVVLELEPRVSLEGTVVSASGAAVSDAKVSAIRTEASPSMSISLSVNDNPMFGGGTPTREDGTFTLLGLEPGDYELTVRAGPGPALAWADGTDTLSVTVPEGGVQGLELRVEARDGTLQGVVVDADGAPVPDAWVRASREGSGKAWMSEIMRSRGVGKGKQLEAKMQDEPIDAPVPGTGALDTLVAGKPVLTDASGAFTITGLREGTYALSAEAGGGQQRARANAVALGSSTTLSLEPLAGLEGVVRSGRKAVSRYTLTLQGPTSRDKTVANAKGHYAIDGLDPGAYTLEVECDEGTAKVEVEVLEGESQTQDVKLEAYGTLRGVVVDAAGEPLAGLMLTATPAGGRPSVSFGLEMLLGGGPRTDRRGRFELEQVPPGEGVLTILDPDSGEGSGASAKYDVAAGSSEDLGTITATAAGDVPMAERGELGLRTAVRDWQHRPLPADADDDDNAGRAPSDAERDRLWIRSVDPRGPAFEAGARPGDEVVSIDGKDVQGLGARAAAARLGPSHVRADDEITLVLERDGSDERVTVTARKRKLPGMPG